MSEETVILWGPRDGKSLKRLYPELGAEPAFKDLPDDELLFVWHYAIKSGPIDPELPDTVRASAAASIAFKKHPDKMKKFSSLSFDERIKLACKKMSGYSPEARAMAKRIAQTALNNLSKMVNVDVDDFNIVTTDASGKTKKEIDWSGRNQYTSSVAKITETLPTLVKQVEEGFGAEIVKGAAFEGRKAIDIHHSTKS